MSIITKSALISNIGSAQLKLFDNYDVETNFEKKLKNMLLVRVKRKILIEILIFLIMEIMK